MDFHFKQSQSQNPHPSKPKNSKRLTKDQARLLETSFISNQKLQAQRKLELAHKLGLSPRQVAVWYQNRRARCKTQILELDNRTIQLKLDSALAEKTRLEKEVGMLKNELNKAQEMILVASRRSPNLPSVAAFGDDDHASSSSLSNRNSGCENAMVSQVEDLYVCFPDWLEGQLE